MYDGWMILAVAFTFFVVGFAVGAWLRGLTRSDSPAHTGLTPPVPSVPPAAIQPRPHIVAPSTTATPYTIVLQNHNGREQIGQVRRRTYRVFFEGHAWDHTGQDSKGRWVYHRTDGHPPPHAHVRAAH